MMDGPGSLLTPIVYRYMYPDLFRMERGLRSQRAREQHVCLTRQTLSVDSRGLHLALSGLSRPLVPSRSRNKSQMRRYLGINHGQ